VLFFYFKIIFYFKLIFYILSCIDFKNNIFYFNIFLNKKNILKNNHTAAESSLLKGT
jgi:hypothetical protein